MNRYVELVKQGLTARGLERTDALHCILGRLACKNWLSSA